MVVGQDVLDALADIATADPAPRSVVFDRVVSEDEASLLIEALYDRFRVNLDRSPPKIYQRPK